jgi:soluble lytic murein transglycosylase-like protein
MSGVGKVGNQPIRTDDAGRKETSRGARGRETAFDNRLSGEVALVRVERQPETLERHSSTTGETQEIEWARERTLEELKTLVQAIRLGVTDRKELTDFIFYARHPELMGVPLTKDQQPRLDEWNQISALLVNPALNEVSDFLGANVAGGEVRGADALATAFERAMSSAPEAARVPKGTTARFDEIIVRAVEWCPGLSPAILKSLLAQESNFNSKVVNQYGYAGIAQFGREAAREVGLQVGIAGSATDERLHPDKAIPGAARLLNIKAQRLGEMAFSRYGQPNGVEFWKFVLAAYNGGEGTVAVAMGHAYRAGLAQARAQGMVGTDAVSFARRYASRWENLQSGGLNSPLAQAAARYFPTLAESKYHEISNYPTAIVARASSKHG